MLLQRGDAAIEDLRRCSQVAGALETIGLNAQLIDLLAASTCAFEGCLLALPTLLQLTQFALPLGKRLPQFGQALHGGSVGLLLKSQLLHLHAVNGPPALIDLLGRRLDLHPQSRSSLINQIDRLVGQLAPTDVAIRQHCGGHESLVGDPDSVMSLVFLLKSAQDGHGVFH